MTTLFRNATLWQGMNDDVLPGRDVLVEDGRITRIGPSTGYRGGGATTIDLDGSLLVPGLIDMHVHLVWSGSPDPAAAVKLDGKQMTVLRAAGNAVRELRAGITTVRDLGGNWDVPITLGRAVEAGAVEGPRIVAAGRTVIMTGGHDPFWGIPSDGPQAVIRAVRRQASLGAGVIKVAATGGVYGRPDAERIGQSELGLEELAAAASEAHRFGLKVAAHALGNEGIRNAVLAGIDTIEHGNFLDEEIVAEMQKRGTVLCPTLRIYQTIAAGAAVGIPEYATAKAQRAVEAHRQSFEMARRAGIPIVAGTDAGSCATPHPALVAELQAMREYGMPTGEVLRAATSTAAAVLGRSDQLGTIEEGKIADLLVLDGNPLDGLETLLEPRAVVQRGKVVGGSLERAAFDVGR